MEQTVTVTVGRRVEGTSRLALGVTHVQRALDTGGDEAAIARGKRLLAGACRFHNVHIMGWGALNPNPAPGVFEWETLDRRLAMVRSIPGAVPVITLCAAPDWMKGGTAGATDWSKIEVAPTPEHYADFAELAGTIARRYPDPRHFQVWNEFKGLWDTSANNWDFRGYTRLYNLVHAALKTASPKNRVGGPYLVIEGTGSGRGGWAAESPIRARQWEVLDYWLKHKRGADFLVVDRSIQDFHDRSVYTEAEDRARTPLFGDIVRQLRERTDLPIWFAEFYAGREKGSTPAARAAITGSTLLHLVRAGASAALLWQPMAEESGDGWHPLFTSVRAPDGAARLPLLTVFEHLHQHFDPGTPLVRTATTSSDLEALASPTRLLLINKRDVPVQALVAGRRETLAPLEVRLLVSR